jgi:hypothetical protein
MSEGDLVRVVNTAPMPWTQQYGIVVRDQFFLNHPGKVTVYFFKLKQQVPISRNSVMLISEAT